LNALLDATKTEHGWAPTHVFKLGPSKVFVKRIPITRMEYDRLFSTENLYRLPVFYNYGVGSAGFGAFRELIAHIKTTNWVLEGAIENFPLMYHYRIRPFHDTRPELNEEWHQGYIRYWNGDERVDHYIRERQKAPYEAVICLEHIPHVLEAWMANNTDSWETVLDGMQRAIAFLRDQGIIHFDAHFWNILVNDGIPYLTDFGLVLDKNFSLNAEEKAFFRRHIDYDYAEFFSGLQWSLYATYDRLTTRGKEAVKRRYEIENDKDHSRMGALLLQNIEEIHAKDLMKLGPYAVDQIIRHRSLIMTMQQFYSQLQRNSKKDTPYPHIRIRRLLKESGIL
jgi:hypothetical protein